MTTPSLRSFLGFLPFAVIAALTACGGSVIGGTGASGQGAGASTGASTHTSSNALAVRASLLGDTTAAVGAGGGSGTSGAGGAGGLGGAGGTGGGGETLYLEIGNPIPSCAVPRPDDASCGDYIVSIGVPPALQQPGVIPLSSPSLDSSYFGTGSPSSADPMVCPGGGGSFVTGTLSIDAIDASSVHFTLSGTQSAQLGFADVDGSYDAPRCP